MTASRRRVMGQGFVSRGRRPAGWRRRSQELTTCNELAKAVTGIDLTPLLAEKPQFKGVAGAQGEEQKAEA